MVLLSSVRIPRVPTYSGYPWPSHNFAYGTVTLFGAAFQPSLTIVLGIAMGSLPRTYCYMRFGLLRFRSPLLSESFLLSFPPGTKMFQFPGFPSLTYGFSQWYCNITCSEFPHSDICGSLFICNSPQLFAACHVLLRRHVPRHPPYALCSLIFLLVYLSFILMKILKFQLG